MHQTTDPRIALSQTIQTLHQHGWATGTGGNFSLLQNRNPWQLLMAPSGVDKGQITPADLIELDQNGNILTGNGRASAETQLHLAILHNTNAIAVLHTHSIFGTLLSKHYEPQGKLTIGGWEMLKGLEGITTHDTTVAIPILPNSQNMTAISQDVTHYLQQQPNTHAILLAGHGLYTWGETLFQARRHVEILEFLFELVYRQLTLPNV